jgi:hypothetical protein
VSGFTSSPTPLRAGRTALRKEASGVESFALPPLVLVQEDGAKLAQVVRRIFELGKDDRPLIDS